jgi:hypothetical protein
VAVAACIIADAEPEEEANLMDQVVKPARCCPECGSREYAFMGREKVPAEAGQPAGIETKYTCKGRGHAWKERVCVRKPET